MNLLKKIYFLGVIAIFMSSAFAQTNNQKKVNTLKYKKTLVGSFWSESDKVQISPESSMPLVLAVTISLHRFEIAECLLAYYKKPIDSQIAQELRNMSLEALMQKVYVMDSGKLKFRAEKSYNHIQKLNFFNSLDFPGGGYVGAEIKDEIITYRKQIGKPFSDDELNKIIEITKLVPTITGDLLKATLIEYLEFSKTSARL